MTSGRALAIVALFSLGVTVARRDEATTVTAAPAIPSGEPEWKDWDTFTSAVLNSTNEYRSQHDAEPLTWNGTLSKFAASYLEAAECEFEHSGGPYGENLAIGYPNATAAVEAWGEEREEYDFDDAEFDKKTGHFTQLVWNGTTDVGCGRALCGERGWYLVCEYWPPGNVAGEFEGEVGGEEDDAGMVRVPWIWAVGMAAGMGGLGWL